MPTTMAAAAGGPQVTPTAAHISLPSASGDIALGALSACSRRSAESVRRSGGARRPEREAFNSSGRLSRSRRCRKNRAMIGADANPVARFADLLCAAVR
jgi:hypothetical protein